MEYRKLGNSGLKVSAISLGGWTTFGASLNDEVLAQKIIEKAIESGINFFDQADVYARGRSEEMMGKILRQHKRENLVISSKVFHPMSDDVNDRGLSRKHIMQSIDKSLKRLGTDYLDIYFCHRFDVDTALEHVVMAMSDLITQGKILYWGTSEWSAAQITEAVMIAKMNGLKPPVTEQPQYSMVVRDRMEREILPMSEHLNIGLVVWSPLAMGLLTGKYDQGTPQEARLAREGWLAERLLTPNNIEKAKKLKKVADELGVSRSVLALAWVLRQKQVSSAITGATKVEQLEENLGAADFRLSSEAIEMIDKALTENIAH